MKALTIRQPYASLIAIGEKHIETRSWNTAYRGELAIHSSKKFLKYELDLCSEKPFIDCLAKHNLSVENLPLGEVIAICDLIDVIPTDKFIRSNWPYLIFANELKFGNFTEGRYAWIIKNVKMLEKPISISGKLGLWNFDKGDKTSDQN